MVERGQSFYHEAMMTNGQGLIRSEVGKSAVMTPAQSWAPCFQLGDDPEQAVYSERTTFGGDAGSERYT